MRRICGHFSPHPSLQFPAPVQPAGFSALRNCVNSLEKRDGSKLGVQKFHPDTVQYEFFRKVINNVSR